MMLVVAAVPAGPAAHRHRLRPRYGPAHRLGLGAALVLLGVVLFEAERHTYAGLRMPWPVGSDRAWRWVHRVAGMAFGLAGIALAGVAWLDPGSAALVLAFVVAILMLRLRSLALTTLHSDEPDAIPCP